MMSYTGRQWLWSISWKSLKSLFSEPAAYVCLKGCPAVATGAPLGGAVLLAESVCRAGPR